MDQTLAGRTERERDTRTLNDTQTGEVGKGGFYQRVDNLSGDVEDRNKDLCFSQAVSKEIIHNQERRRAEPLDCRLGGLVSIRTNIQDQTGKKEPTNYRRTEDVAQVKSNQ